MRIFLSVLFLLPTMQCRTTMTHGQSDDKQILNATDANCDVHPERVPMMDQLYGRYIVSYTSPSDRANGLGTFTRLPKPYLDFVFLKAHAQVTLTGLCQGGLTSWTGDAEGRLPTTISSGTLTKTMNCTRTDSLSHEMGHASYGAVERMHRDFGQALDEQFNSAVLQGHEVNFIAPYARNNREEFFAELFDEYYCSAAARARLRANLPTTYAFAEKYLLPPGGDGSNGGAVADSDKDGVGDWDDLCPGSIGDPRDGTFNSSEYKVWNPKDYPVGDGRRDMAAKFAGCNKNQVPLGIGTYHFTDGLKNIVYVDNDNYGPEVFRSQVPVLLVIFSPGCPTCGSLPAFAQGFADRSDGWYKTALFDATIDPVKTQKFGVTDPRVPHFFVVKTGLIMTGLAPPITYPVAQATLEQEIRRSTPYRP